MNWLTRAPLSVDDRDRVMRKSTTIGAFDAKTRLSELLDRVENGEVITITRHGVPIAKLEPFVAEVNRQQAQRALQALIDLRAEFLAGDPGLSLEELRSAIADGRR